MYYQWDNINDTNIACVKYLIKNILLLCATIIGKSNLILT